MTTAITKTPAGSVACVWNKTVIANLKSDNNEMKDKTHKMERRMFNTCIRMIATVLLCATGLANAAEVRLSAPLTAGDVVVRTAKDGGKLYVLRNRSDRKPDAGFDLQVTGKHREQFSGGLGVTPTGDLFFCGGPNNSSVFEVAAGKTNARLIASFLVPSEDYSYLCDIVAVDHDTLLTFEQSGVVTRLVRDDSEFKTETSRKVVANGMNGGSLSFDPKTETGFLVCFWSTTAITRLKTSSLSISGRSKRYPVSGTSYR